MTTSEHDYLTIAEAAELLRVSRSTIRRSIESGQIRVMRVGARSLRIKREDLQRSESGQRADDRRDPDWWRKYIIPSPEPDMTEEELMAFLEEVNDRILEDNGGVPLTSSLPYLHEARTERDEHLASL